MPIKKIDYKWTVCLACGFLSFCSIGFTSGIISTYLPYMMSTADISRATGGFIFTMRGISAFISLLFIDRYYSVFSLKKGLVIAMLTGAVAFVLYGVSTSLGLYICAAVLSGVVHSLGGIIPLTLMIERWFTKERGLVIGIVAAFSGLTAIIMPPVFTAIAEKASVKYAFLLEALLFLAACALALLVFKPRDQAEEAPVPGAAEFGKETIKDSVRKNANSFSHACLMFTSFSIALLSFGILPNLSAHYIEAGFSSITASFFISIYGIVLTAFKVLHGRLADQHGSRTYAFLSFPFIILCALIPIFAARTHSVPLALFGMICTGIGYSLSTVGLVNFTRALTGPDHYAGVLQRTQAYYAIGAIVAGYLIGKIADMAGSYAPAFILLSGIGCMGFVSILLALARYKGPDGRP